MLMLTKLSGEGALVEIINSVKGHIWSSKNQVMKWEFTGEFNPRFSVEKCIQAANELFDTLTGFGYLECDQKYTQWWLTETGVKLIKDLYIEGINDEWDIHTQFKFDKSLISYNIVSGFLFGLFNANNSNLTPGGSGTVRHIELLTVDSNDIGLIYELLRIVPDCKPNESHGADLADLCFRFIKYDIYLLQFFRAIHNPNQPSGYPVCDGEIDELIVQSIRYTTVTEIFFHIGLCISMFLPRT